MIKYTFNKTERLTGKTTIDLLFSQGESFFCFPYRIVFRQVDDEQEAVCRVLINAPKRLHKTAVARNMIKRRIREAYRLNKPDLYLQLQDQHLQVAILYTSKKVLDYVIIEQKLKEALHLMINNKT